MFVRKDRDGNLIAVGSIDHNRLAQLQGKPKKSPAKAAEPAKAPEPKAVPEEPKAKPPVNPTPPEFKSALDTP
jgi:hypothetical protein